MSSCSLLCALPEHVEWLCLTFLHATDLLYLCRTCTRLHQVCLDESLDLAWAIKCRPDNVNRWTVQDVSTFLVRVGLGKYAQTFAENEITGRHITTLTREEIKDLIKPLGHQKDFLARVDRLKAVHTPSLTPSHTPSHTPSRSTQPTCDSPKTLAFSSPGRSRDAALDLAVMFSCPLVQTSGHDVKPAGPFVDFRSERSNLESTLNESGLALRVWFEAATASGLRKLITRGVRTLHFSGHALVDELALEDGRGAVHRLATPLLQKLISSDLTTSIGNLKLDSVPSSSLQLVFVNACHSERIGQAFVQAGVPHVVCVARDEQISDVAAVEFCHQFYMALFNERTVAEAFCIAQSSVSALPQLTDPSEANRFRLLPVESEHAVTLFTDHIRGNWIDRSPRPSVASIPSLDTAVIGRSVDIGILVSALTHPTANYRSVLLVGPTGIGKTVVAVSCMRYLHQRNMFPGGLFFIDVRNVQNVQQLERLVLSKFPGVPEPTLRPDHLCGVHPTHASDSQWSRLFGSRDCLLVLNRLEHLLENDKSEKELIRLLNRILSHGDRVKLLLASTRIVRCLQYDREFIHNLNPLNAEDACRVLLARCPRPIGLDELWIMFRTESDVNRVVNRADTALVDLLKSDPIIRFLAGHPYAITLAASLLGQRSLHEVRHMLLSSQLNTAEELLRLESPSLTEGSEEILNSLLTSVDLTVQCLEPDAIRLLSLISLLPAGIRDVDVEPLWTVLNLSSSSSGLLEGSLASNQAGGSWLIHLHALEDRSLLNRKEVVLASGTRTRVFELFPFLYRYARCKLSKSDAYRFAATLSSHLAAVARALAQTLFRKDAPSAKQVYDLIRLNLWGMLDQARPREDPSELSRHADIGPFPHAMQQPPSPRIAQRKSMIVQRTNSEMNQPESGGRTLRRAVTSAPLFPVSMMRLPTAVGLASPLTDLCYLVAELALVQHQLHDGLRSGRLALRICEARSDVAGRAGSLLALLRIKQRLLETVPAMDRAYDSRSGLNDSLHSVGSFDTLLHRDPSVDPGSPSPDRRPRDSMDSLLVEAELVLDLLKTVETEADWDCVVGRALVNRVKADLMCQHGDTGLATHIYADAAADMLQNSHSLYYADSILCIVRAELISESDDCDYESTADALGSLLHIYQSAGSVLGEACCFLLLAASALIARQFSLASTHLDSSLQLFSALADRLGEGHCYWLRALSKLLSTDNQQEVTTALYDCEYASSCYEEVKDNAGRFNAEQLCSRIKDRLSEYRSWRPLRGRAMNPPVESGMIRLPWFTLPLHPFLGFHERLEDPISAVLW